MISIRSAVSVSDESWLGWRWPVCGSLAAGLCGSRGDLDSELVEARLVDRQRNWLDRRRVRVRLGSRFFFQDRDLVFEERLHKPFSGRLRHGRPLARERWTFMGSAVVVQLPDRRESVEQLGGRWGGWRGHRLAAALPSPSRHFPPLQQLSDCRCVGRPVSDKTVG